MILLIFFVVIIAYPVLAAKSSKKISPDIYPRDATDAKIYREFELCMNAADRQVSHDKLGGQSAASDCMKRLNEYGKDRASRAFKFYFEGR